MESEDSFITIYFSYFIPCVDGKCFSPFTQFYCKCSFLNPFMHRGH